MKRDCIILTIPERFWKEYPGGRETFDKMMVHVDAGRTVWNQTCATIPIKPVEFAYLIINGKIELRFCILAFQRKATKVFNDGMQQRTFDRRNWAILGGPVIKAPKDYPMKGFQGFRYTEFIF